MKGKAFDSRPINSGLVPNEFTTRVKLQTRREKREITLSYCCV